MNINSKLRAFALENIFFPFWLTDSTDTGSQKKRKKRLILCTDQNGKNQTNKKENNNT